MVSCVLGGEVVVLGVVTFGVVLAVDVVTSVVVADVDVDATGRVVV